VCELWRHIDATVATRWNGTLSVQRLWPVLQNERPEPTPDQAKAKTGELNTP